MTININLGIAQKHHHCDKNILTIGISCQLVAAPTITAQDKHGEAEL
jgi:hypothetical protein